MQALDTKTESTSARGERQEGAGSERVPSAGSPTVEK